MGYLLGSMNISEDWRQIAVHQSYESEGVEKSVEKLWVRKLDHIVEMWGVLYNSESNVFEVVYEEQHISMSLVDIIKNAGNMGVSLSNGLTLTFDGTIDLDFNAEEASKIREFGSFDDAENFVIERR
jgi:hypothetical protein